MKNQNVKQFKGRVAQAQAYLESVGISIPHTHLVEVAARLEGAKGWRQHQASLEKAPSVVVGKEERMHEPQIQMRGQAIALYASSYAVNEYDDAPAFCYCVINQKWIDRLLAVRRNIIEHRLGSVDDTELGPDEWICAPDESYSLRYDSASVSDDTLYFECYEKHGEYKINSCLIDIDPLIKDIKTAIKTGQDSIFRVDNMEKLQRIMSERGEVL